MSLPPKPPARDERVSTLGYLRLFRRDILSAQPARLYRAKMAEFRTPLFHSVLLNQPELVREVLVECPADFPKSDRIAEGLRPLLGGSVFLTNDAQWRRQRRIIDPAFEGGRVRDATPAMRDAGQVALARLSDGPVEIEQVTSYLAADVIFRTLFSIPIEDDLAQETYQLFRSYQRSQPLLNLGALLPLPRWMPRFHGRMAQQTARRLRMVVAELVARRRAELDRGAAPDDLASRIMSMSDPQTGQRFSPQEMVDQVAIFFLAGHETSASALAWALYLLATHPEWQRRVADEAEGIRDPASLKIARNVFRETLRLYAPVPMMVRENRKPVCFRKRSFAPGRMMVISPWHLHRHELLWEEPDAFDPDRWATPRAGDRRDAYLPFSAGPRICPGAGFAMIEGPLLLSMIVAAFRIAPHGPPPVPVAHLTVRAKEGIWLEMTRR